MNAFTKLWKVSKRLILGEWAGSTIPCEFTGKSTFPSPDPDFSSAKLEHHHTVLQNVCAFQRLKAPI